MDQTENVEAVLNALKSYWSARPYLRLAQIVSNAWCIHPTYKKNPEPGIEDVFYFQDKHFLESLELLAKNESKGTNTTEE